MQGFCGICKLAISPVSASGQTPCAECGHLSFSLQRGIEFTMLLTVVILKSLIELSLMFIVGRFLLGLLAGAKRHTNVFWQMLDVAAKPCLWLTRRARSEEHTSELQSQSNLVCRLLLEKKHLPRMVFHHASELVPLRRAVAHAD